MRWPSGAASVLVAAALAATASVEGSPGTQYGHNMVVLDKPSSRGGVAVETVVQDPCGALVNLEIENRCTEATTVALFHIASATEMLTPCLECKSWAVEALRSTDFNTHSSGDVITIKFIETSLSTALGLVVLLVALMQLHLSVRPEKLSELDVDAKELGYLSYMDLHQQADILRTWTKKRTAKWRALSRCALSHTNGKTAGKDMFEILGSEFRIIQQPRELYTGSNIHTPWSGEDIMTFRDEKGNSCLSWQGYSCTKDGPQFGYSEKAVAEIKQNCIKSCPMKLEEERRLVDFKPDDHKMLSHFLIPPLFNDTAESMEGAQRLFDHAVTLEPCRKLARDLADIIVNHRPFRARDEAPSLVKKLTLKEGVKDNTDADSDGFMAKLLSFKLMPVAVTARLFLAALYIMFITNLLFQWLTLTFCQPMMPVVVWCSNEESDYAYSKRVNQSIVECPFRGDQADGLGMLGLTCPGCDQAAYSPSSCPFDGGPHTDYCNDPTGSHPRQFGKAYFSDRGVNKFLAHYVGWVGVLSPFFDYKNYHSRRLKGEIHHPGAVDIVKLGEI